jgi:hypothetical protein
MFIILLIVVTGGLVATAAYFSVVGIASIFAYNYLAAMILGLSLEAGKISVAIYLYRFWALLPPLFKSILIGFMVLLMFITSVGIFGFLSQGYQKTSEDHRVLLLEMSTLEQEYAAKEQRMVEINRQIQQLPGNDVTGRIRLSREFSYELEELRDRLSTIEPRIQQLKLKGLTYESQIGPISYVAKMLERPQDNIVFYAILLLVFVADPLAVTLTVACNMALLRFLERQPVSRAKTASKTTRRIAVLVDDTVRKLRDMVMQSRSRIKVEGSVKSRKKKPVKAVKRKTVVATVKRLPAA